MWVTDRTPATVREIRDTLQFPHALEPPPRGSVLRIVTFPPEAAYIERITSADVRAFFSAMGSPGASTHSAAAPHPYMQKTRTLDFCLILEGEITLVLDTEEVRLAKGDTVVQRGTNHAWSNRSDQPCVVAISSHDAAL
jgi:mannose-6-phosphate isomerase-like protein (cupin superfamily)